MKLLHIDASALGAHSVSRGLTAAVVAEFVRNHPGIEVTYRDLHAAPLAPWALPAGDDDPNAAEGAKALEEFLDADVVVIGAPMYNFGISSTLKAWIDRIAVAGKTFRYTSAGPEGLAGGKRVIVASSRGGIYAPGTPAAAMDFQEPYLRALFGFLGVTDIEFVRAEGLAMGDDHKTNAIGGAMAGIGGLLRKAA
ncbi:NAD(P)H-dependent oxidoreductase [Luteibacter sp. SG786]|uniref:FMN-dependent NADH-azoreductase n=1 Tax=Luteibacter sp. SG786 TaxID=2587130 RepID=UPI00142344BB|nr:NAD(P)H-dependent oxidoreductase [Luteibacter sp. SG786]NII53857.1 FMN-dependent NADH-azoreductase [Luteibacter sp. SG786]